MPNLVFSVIILVICSPSELLHCHCVGNVTSVVDSTLWSVQIVVVCHRRRWLNWFWFSFDEKHRDEEENRACKINDKKLINCLETLTFSN